MTDRLVEIVQHVADLVLSCACPAAVLTGVSSEEMKFCTVVNMSWLRLAATWKLSPRRAVR